MRASTASTVAQHRNQRADTGSVTAPRRRRRQLHPPSPPLAPPSAHRNCYLTVQVYDTDYDEADEYVLRTTANAVEIHGRCSPLDGANSVGPDDTWLESVVRVPAGDLSTELGWRVACDGLDAIVGRGTIQSPTPHLSSPPDPPLRARSTCKTRLATPGTGATIEAPGSSIGAALRCRLR